jgi:hypothetical protein
MNVMIAINAIHAPGVKENQQHKDVNRALLRKPETKLKPTDSNRIELLDEEYAETERDREPDRETQCDKLEIGAPVRQTIIFVH